MVYDIIYLLIVGGNPLSTNQWKKDIYDGHWGIAAGVLQHFGEVPFAYLCRPWMKIAEISKQSSWQKL